MSAITDRYQAVRQAHDEGRIVSVPRPEPIDTTARALHDYLSDAAIPERDRVRVRQLVLLALALSGEGRAA